MRGGHVCKPMCVQVVESGVDSRVTELRLAGQIRDLGHLRESMGYWNVSYFIPTVLNVG